MNETLAPRFRSSWQPTVLSIALLVIATLWLYRDTAMRLVALWGEDETFAHGYLVPIIVAWLLWRKRKTFAAVAPRFAPAWSALPCVAAAAAFWLVGDVAAVNPASQFALIALVILSVPALAGWQATRVVLFPLAFLFFSVPFGEFLLPWLMEWTADFTVLALRATGVPVYRDGLQFVIPSGTWSVVKACSGVRYLLASLMVGALFAYLNYRSTRRRILFMLVAIAVPIIANWLRAYMIVMIGHLSSNKLAVGVDHLIYGWLFFGVVVGLMFAIGACWSELPIDAAPVVAGQDNPSQPGGGRRLWAMSSVMLALLLLPLLVLQSLDAGEVHGTPHLALPAIPGDVAVGDSALPRWTPAFANASATLERRYELRGRPVGLFVGYYRGQGPRRKLVSSVNEIVRSSDLMWVVAESGSRNVEMGTRHVVVRTARLRRPVSSADNTMLAVRQIYWVNGRFEASDVRAKAWGAWYRLLGRGDDGAVVIFYTPEQRPGDADAAIDAVLSEHLAAIDVQLRKTRDGD